MTAGSLGSCQVKGQGRLFAGNGLLPKPQDSCEGMRLRCAPSSGVLSCFEFEKPVGLLVGRIKTAFTLVELLVVIAVIAVLAAILLPVLHRSRAQADSIYCRNNLRQIVLGTGMYVHDTGAYPLLPGLVSELQPYTAASWPMDNYSFPDGTKYLGPGRGLYACPSYNRVQGGFLSAGSLAWRGMTTAARGSYGYNAYGPEPMSALDGGLGGTENAQAIEIPTRESQVVNPSDMIAFADSTLDIMQWPLGGSVDLSTPFLYLNLYREDLQGQPTGDPAVQATLQRHAWKWNVGFCDGHAANLRSNQLFYRSNVSVRRAWSIDNQDHPEIAGSPSQ